MVADSDLARGADSRRLTMSSRSSVSLCSSKWFSTGSEALTGSLAIASSFGAVSEEKTRVGSASSETAPSSFNTTSSIVLGTGGASASMTFSSLAAGIASDPF